MKLTANQHEVLEELEYLNRHPGSCDRTVAGEKWATPMCFGGTDGSHHSGTATALAKRGLVDRYKDGRINFFKSRSKGSCYYRITEAGIAALKEHRECAP